MKTVGLSWSVYFALICSAVTSDGPYTPLTSFFDVASQAISNVNDGLDVVVSSGRRLRDDGNILRVKQQVGDLNARLALAIGHKEFLISAFRTYLENPSLQRWLEAREEMNTVAGIMNGIMSEMDRNQPELVQLAGPSLVSNHCRSFACETQHSNTNTIAF